MAYKRFVGRRGICKRLYSDNAKKFQGANRELAQQLQFSFQFYLDVASILANDGTKWKFIPANAPHCGGLWEAGIKSTKYHLK